MVFTRRKMLIGSSACSVFVASGTFFALPALADDDDMSIVEGLTGRTATESGRVQLVLPAIFPTGSAVPMSLSVDTAMTEADHVRHIAVFAPRNPIVEVISFSFDPLLGVPRVTTRIRLAKPQHVVAVAEMNDGTLLSAKSFVDVATDGCA